MNTVFTVTLYTEKGENFARIVADKSFSRLRRMEDHFSSWKKGSFTWNLNKNKNASLNKEEYHVIKACLDMNRMTDSAFDATVFPLMKIWGFRNRHLNIPNQKQIKAALKKVGSQKLVLLSSNKVILKDDTRFDLGGILKGYAVDRTVAYLKSRGIKAGIVNAGGNLMAFGKKPDGKPWIIGIRHPRINGKLYAALPLRPGLAIATSGDYERFFITNGIRYSHIMNPRTGAPVQNHMLSVSVIHPRGEISDGLATALFVMGPKAGIRFADTHRLPILMLYEQNGEIIETNSQYWDSKHTEKMPGGYNVGNR